VILPPWGRKSPDVFPATRHQRDWLPKVVNVLACLPKASQAGARKALAFKLLALAPEHWRAVNGPHLVPLVRAGARFGRGVLVERPPIDAGTVAA
jgi:hypothetical protein